MSTVKRVSCDRMRKEAKQLTKKDGVSHSSALQKVAVKYKYPNWKAALKYEAEYLAANRPTPKPSKKFMQDDDVASTEDDHRQERIEDLPSDLKINIAKNQAYFVSRGLEFSMFEPTVTGLKKSILDATMPVRAHFDSEDFHSYSKQSQGPEHKVIKTAFFMSIEVQQATKVSLYRPKTKNGDPRMWFSELGSFASPAEQIAMVVFNNELYLFNFSLLDSSKIAERDPIGSFITLYLSKSVSVAEELLTKLQLLANALIPATVDADTAVGRAVETALGLKINSSKLPDYKGIEIKAGRLMAKSRSNLFAQVADWTLSPCASSAEILERYGYQRGDDFKLYCTVSTQKLNSQGLRFQYEENSDQLIEKDKDDNTVAIWPGEILRARLLEKHAETFWIGVSTLIVDGVEHFQLTSVIHTKKPIKTQLLPLIESGIITMDHLIKKKPISLGKFQVSEKGPLFKINKRDLHFLFPEPIVYKLN